MQQPHRKNDSLSEKLWFEYDAYAKLENMITFLLSDLSIFQDYLRSNPAPIPNNLVKQFCENLQEFKKDASDLHKNNQFSSGQETLSLIWEEKHLETPIGKMVSSCNFFQLEKALRFIVESLSVFLIWKEALTSLGRVVMQKMDELQQKITQHDSA